MNEDSSRAGKVYKDMVISLTSERADLQARIQSLTEDVATRKSDLRHTSTAKVRAEDQEKKVREGLRVAESELRVVREELQIARDELRNKAALLDRARCEASEDESSIERLMEKCSALLRDLQRQEALVTLRDEAIVMARREASEAESSIEHLTEECSALRRDLQRQGALVTQRDEAIAMLRDEARGPPNGLLFSAELLNPSLAWTSIFKFPPRRRRKSPFLRARRPQDVRGP